MGKRSSYQSRAINNYYQNREAIAIQRLQELVTELGYDMDCRTVVSASLPEQVWWSRITRTDG